MKHSSRNLMLLLAGLVGMASWGALSPVAWAGSRSPESECCKAKSNHCVHKNHRCYHEGSKQACYHKGGYCYHGKRAACCAR
jgi:hypothetical protein